MTLVMIDRAQSPETSTLYDRARQHWLDADAVGNTLTGKALGEAFPHDDGRPRTPRWGTERIREARKLRDQGDEPAEAPEVAEPVAPAPAPVVVPVVVPEAPAEPVAEAPEADAPSGWAVAADIAQRVIAVLVVLVMAGIAAVASYGHLYHLAVDAGEPDLAPWLPLTVDGLVIVGAIMLRRAKSAGVKASAHAHACLALGLLGSLAGNLSSAVTTPGEAAPTLPGVVVAIVAAWPTLVFFLTHEVLQQILNPEGEE